MDRRALYDEDYFAWLQQQAAALRRLAQNRRDLPNDLDVEQIAEEIEGVGKSELRAARSFIRNILVHVLLVAFDTRSSARLRWKTEIVTFHAGLRSFATPSMRQLIDMDELWEGAIEAADARLQEHVDRLPRTLPERSPVTFEEITAKTVDWDNLILA
jgi:hypothetical protein